MGLKVTGEAELRAFLQQLPEKVAKEAVTDGLKKSAARLRTLLRRAAPRKDGHLRKAIQSRVGRVSGPKALRAWVGVKKIKGEKAARNYYAVLEKGRRAYTRKNGRPVKAAPQMAQNAFMHKTFNGVRGGVNQIQIEATRAAIIKRSIAHARRLGVKGMKVT